MWNNTQTCNSIDSMLTLESLICAPVAAHVKHHQLTVLYDVTLTSHTRWPALLVL